MQDAYAMGLRHLLTSTKTQAVVGYLHQELNEYLQYWSQLPSVHRHRLEEELPEKLDAARVHAGNMSAKGQVQRGISLRHEAKKKRDQDLVGGIALWVQGAWLEAEGRQLAELDAFKATLEFASEAGMEGIAAATRRASCDPESSPAPPRDGQPVEVADRVLTHLDPECLQELHRRASGTGTPNLEAAGFLIGAYEAVFNMPASNDSQRAESALVEALRLLEITGAPSEITRQILSLEASTRAHENSPVTRWRHHARSLCKGEQELRHFGDQRSQN